MKTDFDKIIAGKYGIISGNKKLIFVKKLSQCNLTKGILDEKRIVLGCKS